MEQKATAEPNPILEALCEETGTGPDEWELVDGPESRSGVDYWFVNRHTGQEAYVNDDQGAISVSLLESESA